MWRLPLLDVGYLERVSALANSGCADAAMLLMDIAQERVERWLLFADFFGYDMADPNTPLAPVPKPRSLSDGRASVDRARALAAGNRRRGVLAPIRSMPDRANPALLGDAARRRRTLENCWAAP